MIVRFIALFISAALAGCAGIAPKGQDSSTDRGQDPGQGAKSPELRVFFAPRCPVSNATAESIIGTVGLAVASSLAGKLADGAVDSLGNYLTKDMAVSLIETSRMDGFAASQDSTLTYNQNEGCMILIAAREFGREMTDKEIKALQPFAGRKADPNMNLLLNEITGFSGPLSFYMELTFHFNRLENPSAFTLEPRSWYYPTFFTPQSFRYSTNRDVLLRMELSAPGANGNFGAFELSWQDVAAGEISDRTVVKKKLPWFPLPDGLEAAAKQIKSSEKVPVGPTNIKVLLTETAKPYTVLKYVGEALKANKETISKSATDTVNQAFSQEARAIARSTATAKVEEKYKAYAIAYDEAEAAQQKYASASGAAAKQKALDAAKLAYAKLSAVQASLAAIYGSAEVGAFTPLPDLPPLQ